MKVTGFHKIIVSGACLLIVALGALGDNVKPTDVILPTLVTAGATAPCVVTVEGSGVAHLHSIPSGVVELDVTVQNGGNYVSVPFAAGYVGPVTVYATVEGSTQIVGTTTVVLPS
jgi:hypothetical protein